MAFYSLGLRKNPGAIRPILKKIEASQDWYTQMYAYKALRALGWNQTKSP
jgi:HEAT repeat protein